MSMAPTASVTVETAFGDAGERAAAPSRIRHQAQGPGPLWHAVRSGLHVLIALATAGTVLFVGWRVRTEDLLTAKSGAGYALGIIGGTLMLLLLLYPLRKKARFMRVLGPVRYWFRVHMLFGVAGPVLVLFHANFKFGSLNAGIALVCMLLVAGSGLIGRYIYAKIHHGLYGRRASLQELQQETDASRTRLGMVLDHAPALRQRLQAFEDEVLSRPRGVAHGLWRLLTVGIKTAWTRYAVLGGLKRAFRVMARRGGWPVDERRRQEKAARRYVAAYLLSIRRVAEFSFYERLFSLWHVLHLPLFLMLLIAGAIHVVAVHLY